MRERSPAGWGRGEQRWSEWWIQEEVTSVLDLERITSTSGERALEAKTWKLSVQDVLEEHSGLQELPWKGTKEIGGRGQCCA